jgi:hypothetical protein
MTWNYRVVRFEDGEDSFFQIHEVYYSGDGKITMWSEKAVGVSWCESEGPNGGKNELELFTAALERPVLNAKDLPK